MELTCDLVLEMPAGEELDHLVAALVMGWTEAACVGKDHPDADEWFWCGDGTLEAVAPETDWQPSVDMADAWQVALWLRERFGQFELVAGV